MKAYLNSKLLLFRKILKKKSVIISDKRIREFSILKKIAPRRGLKILDIDKELKKIMNIFLELSGPITQMN